MNVYVWCGWELTPWCFVAFLLGDALGLQQLRQGGEGFVVTGNHVAWVIRVIACEVLYKLEGNIRVIRVVTCSHASEV